MTDGRNCCHCLNGNRFLWKGLNAWLNQTGWAGHVFFQSLACFVINLPPDFHDNRPCCWNKASVINFLREKKIPGNHSLKRTGACSNEFEMPSQNTRRNYISLCLFSYLHRKHHGIHCFSPLCSIWANQIYFMWPGNIRKAIQHVYHSHEGLIWIVLITLDF